MASPLAQIEKHQNKDGNDPAKAEQQNIADVVSGFA
jgi:hypothetical protein